MLFPLGQIVATKPATAVLDEEGLNPLEFVARHARGDWGDVDREDAEQNDRYVKDNGRLFSSYKTPQGAVIWIITESDRSVTTILLPDDY